MHTHKHICVHNEANKNKCHCARCRSNAQILTYLHTHSLTFHQLFFAALFAALFFSVSRHFITHLDFPLRQVINFALVGVCHSMRLHNYSNASLTTAALFCNVFNLVVVVVAGVIRFRKFFC